jgi:5-methylphenazine-1-carboxylate 1-monooxygenase
VKFTRVGLALERYTPRAGAMEVELRDRETGLWSTLETDVLIRADGLHSAVRAHLHPGEGPAAVERDPHVA